jgi:hypothetical protein
MGGIQSVKRDGALRAKSCSRYTSVEQMIAVIGNGTIGDGLVPDEVTKIGLSTTFLFGWETVSGTHKCPSGRRKSIFVVRR